MKLLITGANGFLGSNFVKSCKGHDITCIVNNKSDKLPNNCRVIRHNLMNEINLEEKFDIVVHIAACPSSKICIKEPINGLHNIIQTFNVLEFCRKNEIKNVIFFSSCEVYGIGGDDIKEEHELKPLNMYAASKVSSESMCHAYHKSYGLNFIILRIVNVWGDNCQDDRFCSIIKHRFENEKCPEFVIKTKHKKRWLHVNDMCTKIHSLLNKKFPEFEIFNLVGEENLTQEDFISKFGTEFKVRYELEEPNGYCNNYNAIGIKLSSYLK